MPTLKLTRPAMACEFEIILSGSEQGYMLDVANWALDEIQRLDSQLSCFDPSSEISHLNACAAVRPVPVEPGLFELLALAKQVWAETDGAFDPTAGPLIDLWREAERTGRLPDGKAIRQAMANVGMSHVVLDPQSNSVAFDRAGVRLNLGAIGKGCAVHRAASVLREYDVGSALVSGGGSTIYGLGHAPDGDEWKIGIRHPSRPDERVAVVSLCNRAMSTSGGVAQRDMLVKESYEHIVDPASGGQASPTAASVSVLADDPVLSDALSTAFYLRGRSLAERVCRARPRIEAVFVEMEGADCAVSEIVSPGGGTDES